MLCGVVLFRRDKTRLLFFVCVGVVEGSVGSGWKVSRLLMVKGRARGIIRD